MQNKYLKIKKDMDLLIKLAMKYNLIIIKQHNKNNSLSNVAQ
jgi:hypothetical protein